MKSAAIYERRGKLILYPYSQTSAGVWIGADPVVVFDIDVSTARLGALVRDVLSRSKGPVRHPGPTEWAALDKPLLNAAGVRSWGAFVRGALLSNVRSDGRTVEFFPHENRGPRDGFQPMGLASIVVEAVVSDEELGAAALTALDSARSRDPKAVT